MDNREYAWDDEIVNEGSDFVLLPEGDYDFTISKVERARFNGSDKIPACNMAKVTITVWGAQDKAEITENLLLHSKMEWKLSQFFLALGLKKHGEPLKMNWNAVTGKTGKCGVYIDTYEKKDGSEGKSNKIKKFYAYDEQVTTVSPAQNKPPVQPITYQQPIQTPTNGGWKPGVF